MTRSKGLWARSKGFFASVLVSCLSWVVCSGDDGNSTTDRLMLATVEITCMVFPSTEWKLVRRLSCRRMISLKLCSKTVTFSRPSSSRITCTSNNFFSGEN